MIREERTPRDRVLVALLNAGSFGVSRWDFLEPDVIDGGEPLRLSAVVSDLRDDGWTIMYRRGCACHGRRYALPMFSPPTPHGGDGGPDGGTGADR